jgi:MFS transporter, DHA1 family, multidrug resistance protein
MLRPQSLAITILLATLSAFSPLSTDLYLASLPELVRVFHAEVSRVQLTLSVFLAGFAAGQLIYGSLSDRFGRRPTLLAGMALYFAATLVCMFAWSIEALIVARFFQAIGACAPMVITRAIVRDVHGPKNAARVLSYIASAMTLAPMVGPILGSYLTVWYGWRSNFVVLAVFAALAIAAVWFMLGETHGEKDVHAIKFGHMMRYAGELMRHSAYPGYVVTVTAVFSGIFAFLSGASFVLIQELGVKTERFGLYFAIIVIGYLLGTQIAGRLVTRHGIEKIVRAGTFIVMGAGIADALLGWIGVRHVAAVIGPQFFYMIGCGLVLPPGMAGAVGPFPQMAGLASAVLGFFQMAVAALVGIAVGQLYDGTPVPMTSAIGLMGSLGCLAFALMVWRRGGAPGADPRLS